MGLFGQTAAEKTEKELKNQLEIAKIQADATVKVAKETAKKEVELASIKEKAALTIADMELRLKLEGPERALKAEQVKAVWQKEQEERETKRQLGLKMAADKELKMKSAAEKEKKELEQAAAYEAKLLRERETKNADERDRMIQEIQEYNGEPVKILVYGIKGHGKSSAIRSIIHVLRGGDILPTVPVAAPSVNMSGNHTLLYREFPLGKFGKITLVDITGFDSPEQSEAVFHQVLQGVYSSGDEIDYKKKTGLQPDTLQRHEYPMHAVMMAAQLVNPFDKENIQCNTKLPDLYRKCNRSLKEKFGYDVIGLITFADCLGKTLDVGVKDRFITDVEELARAQPFLVENYTEKMCVRSVEKDVMILKPFHVALGLAMDRAKENKKQRIALGAKAILSMKEMVSKDQKLTPEQIAISEKAEKAAAEAKKKLAARTEEQLLARLFEIEDKVEAGEVLSKDDLAFLQARKQEAADLQELVLKRTKEQKSEELYAAATSDQTETVTSAPPSYGNSMVFPSKVIAPEEKKKDEQNK